MVEEYKQGIGELFLNPDPDKLRETFKAKDKKMVSKVMDLKDAVSKYVKDGDYLGIGGFGTNRIPSAALHEIVRQRKKNLGFAGHTSTHDCQILISGKCINRCDAAYIVGLEARGLSPNARRAFQSGDIKVTEWTNAVLSWRLKAAAMGLPFLPTRTMMGTDTFKYSAAKEIKCPFTGKKLAAVPALSPDVSVIHVHRSDVYGNCQIEGISVADQDLARASKRVILTTEKIISNEEIRREPHKTFLLYLYVDAVIEVPFGCYPGNMPNEYFSDEEHLKEWMDAEKDEKEFEKFLDKYIYSCKNFNEYLEKKGGIERIMELRKKEFLMF